MRLVGSVHIEHPGAIDRERGVPSRAYLLVDRGLKGGRLDEVPLDRAQILDLIADGARVLKVLEGAV